MISPLFTRTLPVVLGLGSLSILPAAGRAQGLVPDSQVRAINTARDAAINLNGGLGVYNPAKCMFETTKLTNPCLISNDQNGYVFRFLGGSPGWQETGAAPTVQTTIRISTDGRTVLQTDYNGVPQQ
ncbi:MAG: hypothetical protein FJ050_03290 [Cyanobacteria bacterium M_surface_7_m2_040]|nr:hypothetical protein [Cyanobacteria bacterium M_surface_9_m1_291]MBM5827070.1 hypothetical protein [Cyanobacteria bacterium M_surface_7_m2_040]